MRIATLFLTLIGIILVSGCTDTSENVQVVEEGDFVKVDYIGELEDGTIFDSSERHGKPLEFTVGKDPMIKGFEKGIIGMHVGEQKTLVIPPEEGYGVLNSRTISVPIEELGLFNLTPAVGENFAYGRYEYTIKNLNDTDAVLYENHALAGKTLIFKVTLVSIGNE